MSLRDYYGNNSRQTGGRLRQLMSNNAQKAPLVLENVKAAPSNFSARDTFQSGLNTVGKGLDTAANVGKAVLSAGSEGTVGVLGAIHQLANQVEEVSPFTLRKMIGAPAKAITGVNPFDAIDTVYKKTLGVDNKRDKEERAQDRELVENAVTGIRQGLGVNPDEMSKTGQLLYNTGTQIPKMLAGPGLFFASAAGDYAQEAEQKGATTKQALAHGLASGGIELGLERALGVVPGVKNLKNITKGGVKGFAKNVAGEALEEAITDPLTKLSEKAIYNKNLPVFSTKEDAVINPGNMLQSGLGGATMTAMLAPFGLSGNVKRNTKPVQKVQNDPLEPLKKLNKNMPVENPQSNAEQGMAEQPVKATVQKDGDFPDLNNFSANEVVTLVEELNTDRQKILDDHVEWLRNTMGQGVQQGGVVRDMWGDVVDRFGRVSNNEKWYQDWAKENNYRRPTKAELYDIARQQLNEGVQTFDGFIPPNEEYMYTERFLDYAKSNIGTPKKSESDILKKHDEVKHLKEYFEHVKATSKLTPDELTIADNIRKGKLSAVPQGFNAQVINEVANAGKLYDQAEGEVKAFNEERKQQLRDVSNGLLEGSDNAKDKAGWQYARETMERNNVDTFGEEAGKRINDTVFRPVHENEAKKTRFINKYVGQVKNLNLTKAESEAVQMLGEGKITENDLPPNVDKGKVKNAVVEFRKTYDGLLTLANDVLVKNGYAPVEYRKDYFPHFESPDDPFVKAMKAMGFKVDNITLPTDIAGITHQFRPGKKWFGNFLRRESDKTAYDALEGVERYLYGISDVIYHTNDIQRLRAFETAIRSKYAPDNIKNRISEIEASGLSQDEQQAAIDELFNLDKGHLGSYVTNLREYTDNLAGKKSISDRNMEHKIGRATYNFLDNMNTQVSRNMVGWNVGSWLTNFIPISQAGAGIKTKNLLKAVNDTVMNYQKDDGFVGKSSFLTNRAGTERLSRSVVQKIADAGMKPMQFIDEFTSNVLVRGKYLDSIEQGLSHQEAIRKADEYVAGAMADRSKGALPTVFNTKNPLTKLFSMFQVEVNNQFSFLFKDIPREAKEQGGKWLASTLLKFMAGSWLYNEIYEKLTGRRPSIDPVGTVIKALKSDTPLDAIQSVGEDVLEQTPFVGGVIGGGRLPISAALPDVPALVKGDAKLGKELLKPATYLLSPFGGGGQAKKTFEGIKAFGQGASVTDTDRMRYPIPKTPLNALRTGVFGQYSTPEAREYFDKERTTLSPNQTQQVMQSDDPKIAYLRIMQERQINSLSQQIKTVAADDTLTRAEKDKKINDLRQKIIKLRN